MKRWIKMLPLLAAILSMTAVVQAADKPSVIRFVVPGYVPEKASPTQLLFTVVWEQNLLQQEFAKDGIRIERILTKQAGPGVNEAFANGVADFGQCGDFPLTIGKAGGLKTKLILGQENGSTTYIIARAGSGIRSVQDLKGKRVGYQKGTNSQPAIIKILALHGMTINDIKSVNVTNADASASLVAGTIDALL
ncbi:MAG TPA: ABC transporter substrate-binding protein, partial [Chlorobaculum sp.]|nr:ABC transporter substrate-binding protein [Chlorobaculum sp.]